MQLVWGVNPLLVSQENSATSTFTIAMGLAQEMNILREGDLVVQTAGTLPGVSGSTDLVRVGIVSAVLGKGLGIGNGSVSGKVCLATTPEEAAGLQSGEILVVRETTADYLDAMRKARGVIAEVDGRDSHAATIAQKLGVPVISGGGQRHLRPAPWRVGDPGNARGSGASRCPQSHRGSPLS